MSKRRRFDFLACSFGCRLARRPRRQKPLVGFGTKMVRPMRKRRATRLTGTAVCNGVHRLHDVIASELSLKCVHRHFIT
jgi:hypothetical protein